MDLQGKVIAALDPRRGTSARGEWVVQSFVIETHDAYPKKMVFDVFGEDRLQRFNIQVGQEVNVSFDIDAHEYQGRWFNSIRAFDVRRSLPAPLLKLEARTIFLSKAVNTYDETAPVFRKGRGCFVTVGLLRSQRGLMARWWWPFCRPIA